MNPAGDYSSAYVILRTSKQELNGHGFSFTIGRGNDLVCAAIRYTAERLVGKNLGELTKDMGKTWRYLVGDSQLRWLGPEKGVVHLGLSACVNALWDLWARYLAKPVWQLVAEMTPDEFVRCIDFRYILDAITPDEAIDMLKKLDDTKIDRIRDAKNNRAVAAYSTQAGWLGFSDEKMIAKMQSMLEEGFDKFKLKVGGSLEDDIRRLKIARDVIGYDKMLMIDANQVWSVPEAIEYMLKLVPFKPV
jgi:L-galactonate dehydratase